MCGTDRKDGCLFGMMIDNRPICHCLRADRLSDGLVMIFYGPGSGEPQCRPSQS